MTTISTSDLRSGNTKSCGCGERKQHGMSRTKTYSVWMSMRQRCSNPNYVSFHRYGGRGITVCERWDKFENFLADMGEVPRGLSIERKDNDMGYSPENCCWATAKEQRANQSVR